MSEREASTSIKYDSLTSTLKDDETVKPYFTALDFAFSQEDVRNIAITGPYGAGKSTVINSYLKKSNIEENSINVSLAGFDIAGLEKELDSQEVELSILQQILYKVQRNELPESRIDRIQNRNSNYSFKLFLKLVKVVFPITLLLTFFFIDTLAKHLPVLTKLKGVLIEHYILTPVAIAILFFIALYYLIQTASQVGIFDKKLKLSKVGLLSGKAEVQSEDNQPSLLNACLDEIVYFFSCSKFRTVVFEDLDRLGAADIFVKLREINKIINNTRKSTDPVRFVYAVKDDIFLGADIRTKFFDFIVPIVPIMDNRNAYTILKNKIAQFPEKDYQCLRGASLYITEMRSLQNIINEYNLFMGIVDNQSSEAKLFALVFYKNLFALDYNLVDKKLGVLYSYMRDFRTKKLHENHFKNLDLILVELEENLEKAKKELNSTSEEIREEILARYIPSKIRNQISFHKKISYYWDPTNTEKLIENENVFINYFSNVKEILLSTDDQRKVHASLGETEINEILEEYKERSALIKGSRTNSIEDLKQKISEAKKNIRLRNEITIAKLTRLIGKKAFNSCAKAYIEAIEDENILSKEQEKTILDGLKYGGFDALYYLITNGYLMQDFMMYRSVFHKGSISEADNEYIKKVGLYISHSEANDSCIIDDVAEVTKELIENTYILRDGALHHQVLTYLLGSKYGKSNTLQTLHLNTLVNMTDSLISRECENIISVMEVFYEKFDKFHDFILFIEEITKTREHQNKILSVLQEMNNENTTHRQIIAKIMTYSNLKSTTRKQDFKAYFEQQKWEPVLDLEVHEVKPFLDNAELFNVIYDKIEIKSQIDKVAAKFIADRCMFTLNKENFCKAIVAKIGNDELLEDDVAKTPWALLLEHDLETIEDYVLSDINRFIEDVFLLSSEGEASIITMLNNDDVNTELKVKIIQTMNFSLKSHLEVQNNLSVDETNSLTLYDLLYKHNRITPSWDTLVKYIESKSNPLALREYITCNDNALSKEVPMPSIEMTDSIYNKIVCDGELPEDTYRLVTTPLDIPYKILGSNISIKNLNWLVSNSKLPLTEDSYTCIINSKKTSSEMLDFLAFWLEKYQDILSDNIKFYITESHDEESSNTLLKEILSSNKLGEELIVKLVVTFIDLSNVSILDELYFSFPMYKNIAESLKENGRNLSLDAFKLSLFTQYAQNKDSTKEELLVLLNFLDEKEVEKVLIQTKQATIQTKMSEQVISFLSALKVRKFIANFDDKGDGKIVVKAKYWTPVMVK